MHRSFIIAGAGINHMGSVDKAKELIDAACKAGCDGIKFHTYQTEDRVSSDHDMYPLLKKCELSYKEHIQLKVHCDSVGINLVSTPFSVGDLSFLVDQLGVRIIKLSSFDITNIKFLQAVNTYGRVLPAMNVILSTGMSYANEIRKALDCFKDIKNLTFMHCMSAYPTPEEQVNLEAIRSLQVMCGNNIQIGYSDHTNDILAPSLSVLVGAVVVEKHFTLDLNNDAVDNDVSADPTMMTDLVSIIRLHEKMLGDGMLKSDEIEEPATSLKRYS